jgi:hypothetical protein
MIGVGNPARGALDIGLERSPIQRRMAAELRAATHPFLAFGRAEEVEVVLRGGSARLIASADGRQVGPNGRVGSIGFIEAEGDPAAFDRALRGAVRWLRGQGAAGIRCPVDLSTWYGHRTIVSGFPEDGGPPPFVLEPRGAPWLPPRLEAHGFRAESPGIATLVPNDRAIGATSAWLDRASAAGFRDRPFDMSDPAADLELLYRLSSAIFAGADGFSEISRDEFLALYAPMLSSIDADLVRILESPAGEPVGFAFAIVDRAGPPGGDPGARFVFKTIGVLPGTRRPFPGLGWAMVCRIHALAGERGLGHGIHAIAAAGSYSARTSSRWGTPLRAYATFHASP